MAISFIGSRYAESTGVTPPTHQAGDLFVCFAYRDGNATAPTLPAGWTNSNSSGGSTNAFRLGYKVATSSSDTCTGWTNASGVILHVYRGASSVGGSSFAVGSSSTLTYNAVTLQDTSGSSWVAAFAGHRSTNTTSIGTPPTSLTARGTLLGANSDYASHDTNGGVTSLPGPRTVATGGTASGFATAQAEILAAVVATLSSPVVSISSTTSGTPRVTTNFNAGTIYMVAVPDGDTPSVAQIKAGQRGNGTAAIASQNKTVTASGVQTFTTVTGLTTDTDYDFWFVHTNAYGDSTAVKADFKPIVRTDTGWMNAGTITSDGFNTVFSNPSNAIVEDGAYTTASLTSSAIQAGLFVRNFNPEIPVNAKINGMEVRVKGMASGNDVQLYAGPSFNASSFNAATTNPYANTVLVQSLTTSNTMYTGGSATGWSTDYWNGFYDPNTGSSTADPTIAQINSSNFGVYFQVYNSSGASRTVSIDTVQLKIYFDDSSTPTLTASRVTQVSSTSGTPQVTTDWPSGTLYMVAVPDGDTPSVAQIKAGQRSNGSAAIASQSKTVATSGVQTFTTVSSLTTDTAYDFWFVHTNANGDSTRVKADFMPLTMYSTGWVYPGSIASPVGVLFNATYSSTSWDRSWTNPSNAASEDGVYATAASSGAVGAYSLPRPLVGHNFGLSIPSDATITGIEVEISARAADDFSGTTSRLGTPAFVLNKDLVAYTSNGWLVGNSLDQVKAIYKETSLTTSATPAPVNWGSQSDKWSGIAPYQLTGTFPNQYYIHGAERAISPADLNSSDFGLAFKVGDGLTNSSYLTASVDYMKIRVTYVFEPVPPAPSNPPPVLFWAFP